MWSESEPDSFHRVETEIKLKQGVPFFASFPASARASIRTEPRQPLWPGICRDSPLPVRLLPLLVLFVMIGSGCGSPEEETSRAEVGADHFSATLIEEAIHPPAGGNSGEPVVEGDVKLALEEEITSSRKNAITRAVERASPAVVSITAREVVEGRGTPQDEFFRYFFGYGIPREFTNMGSGFIISEDGLLVTNQHVVGTNAKEIMVSTGDGNSWPARLIGSDELTDLALLKIDADLPLPYVEFSDSDEVTVGEWAIAMGNPFGLFDGQPAVTVGVVSALNRDFRPDPNNPRVYIDMIQTDAAINRGNSGGPLLDSNGKVIGVNTFIFTGGTGSGFVGLGFAIPSNRVERIITQLLTAGEVVLDYDPGMEFTSMTENLVYRYGLPAIQGLLVTSVNRNGPAFECGLLPGDIILKIGEERVLSEMHAWAIFREYRVGSEMDLEILRDGEQYQTRMLLRKRVAADEAGQDVGSDEME